MLSRSLASGAMLFTVVGLSGVALVDEFRPGTADAAVIPADIAVIEPAEIVRPAEAPNRVVETAGFPVVPETAAPQTTTAAAEPAPTVTVNGQPLGSTWAPATTAVANAPASSATTNVALAEELVAPTPIRRPEGLTLPSVPAQASLPSQNTLPARPGAVVQPNIDYEAITASAFEGGWNEAPAPQAPQTWGAPPQTLGTLPQGGTGTAQPTWGNLPPQPIPAQPIPSQPQLLGPVGQVGGFVTAPPPSPQQQGLVQVTGANGETLWVYPDQAQQFNSAPTVLPINPFSILR